MKKEKLKPIYLFPAIIFIVAIFCFSAKTAEQSSHDSGVLVESIINIVFPDNGEWDLDYRKSVANTMEIIFRKTAHATEFAVLELLLFFGLSKGRFVSNVKNSILVSAAISILYACSDEFHQLFVPGRSGQITDVMIDGLGICFAAVILAIPIFVKD